MRVLSQAEIDAMLASMLSNPTILPGHENDKSNDSAKKNEESKTKENK